MKVAYIVGLGRSGSTLLDLMLNAHSQVFSVGEVKILKRYAFNRRRTRLKARGYLTSGNRCTCQAESIWQCNFWSQVNKVLKENYGGSLLDLNIKSSDDYIFQRDNKMLFQAIGEVSGARVVVDSSKSLKRLMRLKKIPELEVYPIHLVRNPLGRTNSVRKDRFKVYIPAIHYSYDCLRTYLILWAKSHEMVRYEDIVCHPKHQLHRVMQYMGLKFEEGQLHWANQDSHNLGGNRMRRSKDSSLEHDISWKHELTVLQKIGVSLLSAPGRVIYSISRS